MRIAHTTPSPARPLPLAHTTTCRMVPLDAMGDQDPSLLCTREPAHFPAHTRARARALAQRLGQHGTHLRPLHVRTRTLSRTRTRISRPVQYVPSPRTHTSTCTRARACTCTHMSTHVRDDRCAIPSHHIPSHHISIHLSTHQPSIHLSTHPPVLPSTDPSLPSRLKRRPLRSLNLA